MRADQTAYATAKKKRRSNSCALSFSFSSCVRRWQHSRRIEDRHMRVRCVRPKRSANANAWHIANGVHTVRTIHIQSAAHPYALHTWASWARAYDGGSPAVAFTRLYRLRLLANGPFILSFRSWFDCIEHGHPASTIESFYRFQYIHITTHLLIVLFGTTAIYAFIRRIKRHFSLSFQQFEHNFCRLFLFYRFCYYWNIRILRELAPHECFCFADFCLSFCDRWQESLKYFFLQISTMWSWSASNLIIHKCSASSFANHQQQQQQQSSIPSIKSI